MSSAKKIGLFACTGVVAGNMMGSGIALLPANLASIGGIAIWGWVISIIGAMSLAYVYARLATKGRSYCLRWRNISGIRFPDRCPLLSCKLDW